MTRKLNYKNVVVRFYLDKIKCDVSSYGEGFRKGIINPSKLSSTKKKC